MSNIPQSIKEKIQKNARTVTKLDLSNLGLNDDDLSELTELLSLNYHINSLNLSNNNITSKGCRELQLVPRLKKVDLSYCSIGDKGVHYLIATGITELIITDCNITEKGALELEANLSKYTSLSMVKNPRVPRVIHDRIDSKFGRPPSYPFPIGIDLGLNIHSCFEKKILDTTPIFIEPGEVLADKLCQEYKDEIDNLSYEGKKELILELACHCGVAVQFQDTHSVTVKK